MRRTDISIMNLIRMNDKFFLVEKKDNLSNEFVYSIDSFKNYDLDMIDRNYIYLGHIGEDNVVPVIMDILNFNKLSIEDQKTLHPNN